MSSQRDNAPEQLKRLVDDLSTRLRIGILAGLDPSLALAQDEALARDELAMAGFEAAQLAPGTWRDRAAEFVGTLDTGALLDTRDEEAVRARTAVIGAAAGHVVGAVVGWVSDVLEDQVLPPFETMLVLDAPPGGAGQVVQGSRLVQQGGSADYMIEFEWFARS